MSMKKIYYLLLCAFALVAVTFTSCKDDDDKNLDNLTGDGFYVVGEACPFKSISENGANASLMAVGRNEAAGKEKHICKQDSADQYAHKTILQRTESFRDK